jgi:sigma-B regulation protein RsbU (phosphoserine phosphatase)
MMTQTPLAPFVGERSPRILAVDDQPVNLRVLGALLRRWGCTVHTAASGAEAVAAVRSFEPDLILLDIMMPGESGFEVCARLQADPATSHIPIIFLTALTNEESKVKGFDTGARDYITKPFDSAELAARAGTRLREKYAEDTLRARRAELAAKMPTEP